MTITQLQHDLQQAKNPQKAKILQRFFKTAPGQYGYGDIFLGITVPLQRKIAKQYLHLTLAELQLLLHTNIHEQRLTALIILTEQYKQSQKQHNTKLQQSMYQFYLKNTNWVNNWDLVDVTAPQVVGSYLLNNPQEKQILYTLAKSQNIWQRRIAIVSTFTFIRNKQFQDTLQISTILLKDNHDLIHKAVGWMLREVGKKNISVLEQFLQEHSHTMPRTMLRYAIEKFSQEKRKSYLLKKQN